MSKEEREEQEDMKRIGLDSLLGEKVLLLCGNYFYAGVLVGVNKTFVKLNDAAIVYETGEWSASAYKDAQKLGPGPTFVRIQWIEAYRRGK
jgi:hypothetical protein